MNDVALRTHLMAMPLDQLMAEAGALRDAAGSPLLTYSRKLFIPLTRLCRDVCAYCTFATAPRDLPAPYMTPDEVMTLVAQGRAAGCAEALITLGDKPEDRYAVARAALESMGHASTIDFVEAMAGRILHETGMLPHINAGVLDYDDYVRLRRVSASMGLMLESTSRRLLEKGMPHHGSPDKDPDVRIASIAAAGRAGVPFTTGLLIGIGETRAERLDALLTIRDLHREHGHIQEVIIQNFRAKADTRMANAVEPSEDELLWTLAAARLILGAEMGIQSPPNLNPGRTLALIKAGLSDWGGISPVTIDHVNPEAPWPEIDDLALECDRAGKVLAGRLTIYPAFAQDAERWLDADVAKAVMRLSDSSALHRQDRWCPGSTRAVPGDAVKPLRGEAPFGLVRRDVDAALLAAARGESLSEDAIATLLEARGEEAHEIVRMADAMRRDLCGDTVTYVINRNINYTNICSYACSFCAFSKSSAKAGYRDTPYLMDMDQLAEQVREAAARRASEVCLQGGIHPAFTGETYREIVRTVKRTEPSMHVHAFSPLEVTHGASTLGLSTHDYLAMLKAEGLGSLPGTAAEILDDEIRAQICPDKLNTAEWLAVIRDAHRNGIRTTATIMFGHLERPIHQARHIAAIRALHLETGGFTEFVPLPFVHMESPMFKRGQARMGPTWRETLLLHAVARIALHGAIGSIQTSWVKLGAEGAAACLSAGCNDLGGVLMNESISRAAGAAHGQEMSVDGLERIAALAGRPLERRTTLYDRVEVVS